MSGLDRVLGAIRAVDDKPVPVIRRGTMVAGGTVQLDGDSEPLVSAPLVLGPPIIPDQRVLTIGWSGNRAMIGAGWQPPNAASEQPTTGVGPDNRGRWYRWESSRLQICTLTREVDTVAIKNVNGPLFTGDFTWIFPQPFSALPAVTCGQFRWGKTSSWGVVSSVAKAQTFLRGYDIAKRESGTKTLIQATAIGQY